ncbi:hypothetical protein MY4824_002081 [Beauveria thailandica]
MRLLTSTNIFLLVIFGGHGTFIQHPLEQPCKIARQVTGGWDHNRPLLRQAIPNPALPFWTASHRGALTRDQSPTTLGSSSATDAAASEDPATDDDDAAESAKRRCSRIGEAPLQPAVRSPGVERAAHNGCGIRVALEQCRGRRHNERLTIDAVSESLSSSVVGSDTSPAVDDVHDAASLTALYLERRCGSTIERVDEASSSRDRNSSMAADQTRRTRGRQRRCGSTIERVDEASSSRDRNSSMAADPADPWTTCMTPPH